MRRFALCGILCLTSAVASAQITNYSNLDDTWMHWSGVLNPNPQAQLVEFRWKRTGKPEYRCELEFRLSLKNDAATVHVADFYYEISYAPNVIPRIPGQRKKFTGGLLALGVSPQLVTIPDCYAVNPSVTIHEGGGGKTTASGGNRNATATRELAEIIYRQGHEVQGPNFAELSSNTRSLVAKGADVNALTMLKDGRRVTPLTFALERAKDCLDSANQMEADDGPGSEGAQSYRQEASGWKRFADLLRGLGAK